MDNKASKESPTRGRVSPFGKYNPYAVHWHCHNCSFSKDIAANEIKVHENIHIVSKYRDKKRTLTWYYICPRCHKRNDLDKDIIDPVHFYS